MRRLSLHFVLALFAGAITMLGLTSPARADLPGEVNLGSIDINAYCLAAGYSGGAVQNGSSATAWKCKDAAGGLHGISMTAACQYQFSDLVAAGYAVWDVRTGGAAGWRCHTIDGGYVDAGGVDINQYCVDVGYSGGARLAENNVAGWRCRSGNGTEVPVNLHSACRQQHPNEVSAGRIVVATYENWAQPFGVNCFAF